MCYTNVSWFTMCFHSFSGIQCSLGSQKAKLYLRLLTTGNRKNCIIYIVLSMVINKNGRKIKNAFFFLPVILILISPLFSFFLLFFPSFFLPPPAPHTFLLLQPPITNSQPQDIPFPGDTLHTHIRIHPSSV